MRFVVIGSNSFLGASFIAHLIETGHTDIVALSRSPQAAAVFLPYKLNGGGGSLVEFVQCDLNHDLDPVVKVLGDGRPVYVLNFAAQSMVAESWDTPEDWMQTNVVALTHLAGILRRCEWLKAYVHVTTPEVYGSTPVTATEDQPFKPTTPYAVSRVAGDLLLRTFFERYGFPVKFVRPGNVYGPGQRPYRIVAKTILSATRGEILPLDGGGTSERSFVHAADVSDAIMRVAARGRPGETYHISGYELVTIRRLVEMILERMFKRFDDCVDTSAPERPGKDQAYRMDSAKIRSELGWRDRIGPDVGISTVIQWARRFERELADVPLTYQHKP